MLSRAKSKDICIQSIERSQTGLLPNQRPGPSDWKIAFILSPKPTRRWQEVFEQIRSEQSNASLLSFSYELNRPQSRVYYHYVGASMWERFRRTLRHRGKVMLTAVCPAGGSNLVNLHAEARNLITMVNLQFNRTGVERATLKKVRESEVRRLSAAIDELERRQHGRPFWAGWVTGKESIKVFVPHGAERVSRSGPSDVALGHSDANRGSTLVSPHSRLNIGARR